MGLKCRVRKMKFLCFSVIVVVDIKFASHKILTMVISAYWHVSYLKVHCLYCKVRSRTFPRVLYTEGLPRPWK